MIWYLLVSEVDRVCLVLVYLNYSNITGSEFIGIFFKKANIMAKLKMIKYLSQFNNRRVIYGCKEVNLEQYWQRSLRINKKLLQLLNYRLVLKYQ